MKHDVKPRLKLPLWVFILLVGLWLVGIVLSVLAMTDLFSEPLFQQKNTAALCLQFFGAVSILGVTAATLGSGKQQKTN